MGNITENRLNAVIAAADLTTINTSIATISSKLPTASLTEDQRELLKAIDADNKIFVEDVLIEMGISGSGILPAFINQTFISNDLSLFEQLDTLEAAVANLARKIADLKRIAGDEAYTAALAVYKIYDGANRAGVPGAKQAYDKLKVRFNSQNTGAGRKADPDLK
jgi:hypothetical protein